MRFRWSGATACDVETAAARLNDYFRRVGYRALPSELRWARGSLWKALTTMSPRQLPMVVEAKVNPWGTQTLVDVTYEFPRTVRALSEQDADLIVAELRGLNEYLQHGAADFEAMLRLERAAQRRARAALLNTLGLIVLISLPLAGLFGQLRLPPMLASTLGGLVGGLLASYLFWRFMRRR
ncbi:MAG: hypothetical protein WHS44_05465 [Fimbriimonadales bacterium]|nr:MAG: hypothetical protein KatS3mg018_2479 [Fimbriimonadales bacterium]